MIQTIYEIYQSVLLQSDKWADLLCHHHLSRVYVQTLLFGPFSFTHSTAATQINVNFEINNTLTKSRLFQDLGLLFVDYKYILKK